MDGMRSIPFILCFGLIGLSSLTGAQAPDMPAGPDPREIPLPPIATKMGALPGVTELPVRAAMPDVMVMNDGTKVASRSQWQQRREEMRRILSYYAVGQMPPAPRNVKGREVDSELVLGGTVRYRLVRLTFGPKDQLSLDIGVFTPAKGGPFPAVILQGGSPPGGAVLPRLPQGPNQGRGENVLLLVGPNPSIAPASEPARGGRGSATPPTAESVATQRADVLGRGYALVLFNPNDCAEDTTLRNLDGSWAFRNTRFFPAYPGYDWGILAGWAWGASRVADYLEQDASIDKGKLIITGASRNGKAAMIATAFDDRLMGAPVVTGGGGMGAYRFAGPRGTVKRSTSCSSNIRTGSLPTCASFEGSRRSCRSISIGSSRSPHRGRSSRSKETPTESRCRKPSGNRSSARSPRIRCSAPRIVLA